MHAIRVLFRACAGSGSQSVIERSMTRMFTASTKAFGAPDLDAVRRSACPHQMYARLVNDSPVRDLGDGYYSLVTMADILFATRHPAVEQGSKYLGSDRPAIPLGLDGEEHRRYRHLLDPIFTAKKVAPLADGVRKLAAEITDGFVADGQVNAYSTWCEALPSTIFLSIMGLPMADLDDFLVFKNKILNADPALSEEARFAGRMEAVTWIQSYFNRSLDERERKGAHRDDIIGMLMSADRWPHLDPPGRARHPRPVHDRRARHHRRVAGLLPQLLRPQPGDAPPRRLGSLASAPCRRRTHAVRIAGDGRISGRARRDYAPERRHHPCRFDAPHLLAGGKPRPRSVH